MNKIEQQIFDAITKASYECECEAARANGIAMTCFMCTQSPELPSKEKITEVAAKIAMGLVVASYSEGFERGNHERNIKALPACLEEFKKEII